MIARVEYSSIEKPVEQLYQGLLYRLQYYLMADLVQEKKGVVDPELRGVLHELRQDSRIDLTGMLFCYLYCQFRDRNEPRVEVRAIDVQRICPRISANTVGLVAELTYADIDVVYYLAFSDRQPCTWSFDRCPVAKLLCRIGELQSTSVVDRS